MSKHEQTPNQQTEELEIHYERTTYPSSKERQLPVSDVVFQNGRVTFESHEQEQEALKLFPPLSHD